MLKITITVKDNNNDSCKVDIKPQKDISKCSKAELTTGRMVVEKLMANLRDLEEETKKLENKGE